MAALADMEELLGKISNKDVVAYMREASLCYGAGAMRGCIVLSYIALFDDMRAKLAQLAKINAKAKAIWKTVEKNAADQQVFESYMADQLHKEGFLTTAEHKQLGIVRDIRNRAAHPSGVEPKPEEARYIYRIVIDDFLSQALLKTTHAVDALIERLDKSSLFPTSNVDDIVEIAKQETKSLHAGAYPYLIRKLVEASGDSDADAAANADRMLVGLAKLGNTELRGQIRQALIAGQSHDGAFDSVIGRVISADGKVLDDLDSDVMLRIRALLERNIKSPSTKVVTRLGHPAKQIASLIAALGEEAALKDYDSAIGAALKAFPYSTVILDSIGEAEDIQEKLIKIWKKNARSTTYDTANAFADALSDLDEYAEAFLSGEDALHLISGVVDAAEWNARRAKAIRADKFAAAPTIRKLALGIVSKQPKAANKILQGYNHGLAVNDFVDQELSAP